MIELSILICSLESRKETRTALLEGLRKQIEEHYIEATDHPNYLLKKYIGKSAEVIVCTDNKQMSVGAKRNLLLKEASGEYIAFIDDDDVVSFDYVSRLLEKIQLKPDCIVFNVARYANGKPDRMVSYGIEHKRDHNTPQMYYRIPNHLMCVKKSIALQVRFKEISFGEDAIYAIGILPLIKTQERIEKSLYAYYFDDKLTETAKKK